MAQYDADSIFVYQAYRRSIADYATRHQRFGGEFSYTRMSWIKPNFLWMMYRSGWASKEGQECILAIQINRKFFEELLLQAVVSNYDPTRFASHGAWKSALADSDVRLQWDPDHDPFGKPLARRAIQLGLRGRALRRFGEDEIVSIQDITDRAKQGMECLGTDLGKLTVPQESIYSPTDKNVIDAINLDS